MVTTFLLLISLLLLVSCNAFVSVRRSHGCTATKLFAISEWRDKLYNLPGSNYRGTTTDSPPPKQICILPFSFHEALLQGETKQLRLYEDRFIQLFNDSLLHHESVVAMGLLASNKGLIQTVPLCEIQAYNRMDDTSLGIFVTVRVVGRAHLLEITQQEPYIRAVCQEVHDDLPPNLELLSLAANNIESYVDALSKMEQQLLKARQNKGSDSKQDGKDPEMQRRIAVAKLVRINLWRTAATGRSDY
jgi:hypothetical protein